MILKTYFDNVMTWNKSLSLYNAENNCDILGCVMQRCFKDLNLNQLMKLSNEFRSCLYYEKSFKRQMAKNLSN